MNFKRQFYMWSRWLHIYASTSLFGLLIFFCVTGWLLNHSSWFGDDHYTFERVEHLSRLHIENLKNRSELEAGVLDWIEEEYQLGHVSSVEWLPNEQVMLFDFTIPAGYLVVTVDINSQEVLVEGEQGHWLSIAGELHKGRHSGLVWSLIIDATAILVVVFSVSGLVLLYINRAKRKDGFLAVFAGGLMPIILYFLFVPHF